MFYLAVLVLLPSHVVGQFGLPQPQYRSPQTDLLEETQILEGSIRRQISLAGMAPDSEIEDIICIVHFQHKVLNHLR